MAGRHVRHIHTGLWERKAPAKPRVFMPNIQTRKVQVTRLMGATHKTALEQIKVCAKCIKRITNYPGWKGYRLPPLPKAQ